MLVYPDMHNAIRLNLDKSSSLVGNPDFLPEELDYWLNNAQDRFVKQRLFGNNPRGEKLEQGVKRISDLQTLVVSTRNLLSISYLVNGPNLLTSNLGWVGQGGGYNNVVEAPIPSFTMNPFMYYISSTLYDANNNSLNCGRVLTSEELPRYISDSINNPYIERPLVYLYNTSYYDSGTSVINTMNIAFVYDLLSFIPVQYSLTYIKIPRALTSQSIIGQASYPSNYLTNTCELSPETHEEIVNIAVSLIIENIESPRVQSFSPINQSNIE